MRVRDSPRQAQLARRRRRVAELLLAGGTSQREIADRLFDEGLTGASGQRLDRSTVSRDITFTLNEWRRPRLADMEVHADRLLARCRHIYAEAVEAGTGCWPVALRATELEARLLGLDKPELTIRVQNAPILALVNGVASEFSGAPEIIDRFTKVIDGIEA